MSPEAFTLLDLVGMKRQTPSWDDSTLFIIDAQKFYTEGKLRLNGIDEALEETANLLKLARRAGAPVVHVLHQNPEGAAFADKTKPETEPVDQARPIEGEAVVIKTLPSGFAKTNLADLLEKTGKKKLIVSGYMTHMCLSTTVRAAVEYGYFSCVVASATATRDLLDGFGGTVPAEQIKRVALAELNDRFAAILPDTSSLAN